MELNELNKENSNNEEQNVISVENNPNNNDYKTNSALFHFLSVFAIIFSTIFFLCQIYLTPIMVVGQSMLPTINAQTTSDSDTYHCDVVYYRSRSSYTYGDIVIISNQKGNYIDNTTLSKPIDFLIKRVIACPGDSITFFLTDIENNKYYYDIIVKDSNGNQIELDEENYINEKMYFLKNAVYGGFYTNILPNLSNDTLPLEQRQTTITINNNCYFVMGDNRNNSSDSRYFGEVNYNDISGNVRLQVKYGENIWIALLKKLKSYLSNTYIYLKENL